METPIEQGYKIYFLKYFGQNFQIMVGQKLWIFDTNQPLFSTQKFHVGIENAQP